MRGLKSLLREKEVNAVKSHPTRVRGLKSEANGYDTFYIPVAPYAGAWIEILTARSGLREAKRRTLRGCVD